MYKFTNITDIVDKKALFKKWLLEFDEKLGSSGYTKIDISFPNYFEFFNKVFDSYIRGTNFRLRSSSSYNDKTIKIGRFVTYDDNEDIRTLGVEETIAIMSLFIEGLKTTVSNRISLPETNIERLDPIYKQSNGRVFYLENGIFKTVYTDGLVTAQVISEDGVTPNGVVFADIELTRVYNLFSNLKSDMQMGVNGISRPVPILTRLDNEIISRVVIKKINGANFIIALLPKGSYGPAKDYYGVTYLSSELGTLNKKEENTNFTTFSRESTVTKTCFFSNKPIYMNKFLSLRKDGDIIIKDTEGRYAYLSAIKDAAKYTGLGIKKVYVEEIDKTIFKFKEKAESNVVEIGRSFTFYQQINGYGSNPDSIKFLSHNISGNKIDLSSPDSHSLYMGVEFEFDTGGHIHEHAAMFISALSNYRPYAWVTRDGSVGNGFEGKTCPATIERLLDRDDFDFELAFNTLKKLNYTGFANNTCGLHIHISKSYFGVYPGSESSYIVLGILATIMEKNWEALSVFSRRVDKNTLQTWAANNRVLDGRGLPTNKASLLTIGNTYQGRRSAVHGNKNSTYEFRIFKGTLDVTSLKASMQLVNNIAVKVKEILDETQLLNSMITASTQQKLIKLYSMNLNDFAMVHSYPELNEYLLDINKFYKD